MKYKLLTPATVDALTLAEVKAHLRVDSSTDDNYITQLIKAVTNQVEQLTGRQLLPATWVAYADSFDEALQLRPSPVSSVTSIKYNDSDNTEQTLSTSDYFTDLVAEPAVIVADDDFPDTYPRPNAITITFVAGYADAASVPAAIKHAMLLLIGHFYDRREELAPNQMVQMPKASDFLLQPYKIKTF